MLLKDRRNIIYEFICSCKQIMIKRNYCTIGPDWGRPLSYRTVPA